MIKSAVAIPNPFDPQSSALAPLRPRQRAAGERPRILVVDDDEAFRVGARKLLTEHGFEVVLGADFREALKVLESSDYLDLLVTDIMMPGRIHGFALARMARMRRLGLKVLYITGYDVPTVEAAGKVLCKPISDEELLREVRAALDA